MISTEKVEKCKFCDIVAVELVSLYDTNRENKCCRTCKRKLKNNIKIEKIKRDHNVYNEITRKLDDAAGKRQQVNVK